MRSFNKLALAISFALSTPLHAANFAVTQSNDDGTGSIEGSLSWAILRANETSGTDNIILTKDVTITGVMERFINSNTKLMGNGHSISGNNQFRPLFIKSGDVRIQDVILTEGSAQGEDGSGGGAGLGGALFIYDGNVFVEKTSFVGNKAKGGDSGSPSNKGGGMGIAGGNYGGFDGEDHHGDDNEDGPGGNGVGGNGGFGGDGGCGFGGQGGGHFGDGNYNSGGDGIGGNGGFGGGGGCGIGGYGVYGGGDGIGGDGGFGGGGGSGYGVPLEAHGQGGNGGFGGGGGGANSSHMYHSGGAGGFGGGDGNYLYDSIMEGGGGAGFGGAIFQKAGTLLLVDVSFENNTATRGTGYENGLGKGGAVFVCTSNEGGSECSAVAKGCNINYTGNSANDGQPDVFGTIIYSSDCTDTDGDTIPDDLDNCAEIYNPNQDDQDQDGIGDKCDSNPRITPDCSLVRDEVRIESYDDLTACKTGLTWQEIKEQCHDERLRFHASVWASSNLCPTSTIEELVASNLTFSWGGEEYTAEEVVDIVNSK